LTETERYAVADHVVAQLKERGDPWHLLEEGHRQQIELLVADVDPPAQVRVPLPASSGAGGAAQAGNSYPYAAATTAPTAASAAMTRAAATVTNAATDVSSTAAATGMSAT
jgi:hypothetical protein